MVPKYPIQTIEIDINKIDIYFCGKIKQSSALSYLKCPKDFCIH